MASAPKPQRKLASNTLGARLLPTELLSPHPTVRVPPISLLRQDARRGDGAGIKRRGEEIRGDHMGANLQDIGDAHNDPSPDRLSALGPEEGMVGDAPARLATSRPVRPLTPLISLIAVRGTGGGGQSTSNLAVICPAYARNGGSGEVRVGTTPIATTPNHFTTRYLRCVTRGEATTLMFSSSTCSGPIWSNKRIPSPNSTGAR
jgi:hypothetical protein